MEYYQNQAQLFKLLMHPTRLAILDVLRDGEQCVCHMEALFGLRQAHISQHLMLLREAGLVIDRRDGWNIYYRTVKPEIYTVLDAMSAYSEAAGSPQRVGKIRNSSSTPAQPPNCPCPKCSTEDSPARLDVSEVQVDWAERAS